MACRTVTSLEDAEEQIPATLFPIQGLRRGPDGGLTLDAVRTVVDGLKSRGIDPKDPAMKAELLRQMEVLFCSVNNQYQYLTNDMFEALESGKEIPARRIGKAIEKNQYLLDLLTVLRHIQRMGLNDDSSSFIEAWQNPTPPVGGGGLSPTADQLKAEQDLIKARQVYELKLQRMNVTEEKNRVATNYIGLYGFLNLVAVGLAIYAFSS